MAIVKKMKSIVPEYKSMNYEEEVRNSAIFTVFPFEKKAKDYIFGRKLRKDLLWPLYVLSRIHNNVKQKSYKNEA